jgi:beta-galactosidase
MRDHPEYSGQFLWSGIDYLGEAGRWPGIGSGSGLLLSTALPRARAYERQSWWTDPATAPMVSIARRVQPARRGPIDPGYPSPTSSNQQAPANPSTAVLDLTTRFTQPLLLDWTPQDQSPHTENVEVYTNAEEVELFLNDKSLGTQKLHADASPITFQLPFAPGTLKAVGRIGGKVVAQNELRTAGKPARLILTTETPNLAPDWNDIAYATATLVDANGTVIPDSTTLIHFSISGLGKIIAVDNGNMTDHDPFQSTDRKLYEGHAIAIFRATAPNGSITVTATGQDIPSATLTLKAAAPVSTASIRSF